MPSAIKWEGSQTSRGNVLSAELNNLSNDTITAVGTEVDNSTNHDTLGWLEINVTFGSAPTDASPTLNLGISYAPDGTNYASPYVTGFIDQDGSQIIVPVRKVTSAQRLVVGPFSLDPAKLKFQLDNQTGVSFPASGSTVELFTNNLESQ
jgi:hypothetical protein